MMLFAEKRFILQISVSTIIFFRYAKPLKKWKPCKNLW